MTHRSTTAWQLAGTKTFRLGSREIFKLTGNEESGWGTNLQNPSANLSRIYIPDEDKIFIQVDQAGAEALVVAYLVRDANFRALFNAGIKSHVYVALHLFIEHWSKEFPEARELIHFAIKDVPRHSAWKALSSAIKKHDKYYAIGKMVCHASNYGMEPPAFRMNVLQRTDGKIVLTKEESEKFLGLYHSLFPEIRQWHGEIDAMVAATRTLYNLQGYPIHFGGNLNNSKAKKESYARIPQSTVGTITNIAYGDTQDFIEQNSLADEWDVLVNKHDSLLLQVPIDHKYVASKVLSAALQPKLVGRDGVIFNMKTECQAGYNWGKYNEENNSQGMRDYDHDKD